MVPDTTASPVTEFVGRDVYTATGTHVGTATGVAVDLKRGVATSLTVADLDTDLFGPYPRDARGVHVPFRWVDAVDDIVVVSPVIERFSPPIAGGSDDSTGPAGEDAERHTDDAVDGHRTVE